MEPKSLNKSPSRSKKNRSKKKLGKAGKSWEKLGKAGKSWEKLGKAGKSWEKLGKAGKKHILNAPSIRASLKSLLPEHNQQTKTN